MAESNLRKLPKYNLRITLIYVMCWLVKISGLYIYIDIDIDFFLLLYNQMFEFFIRNDLISQNQSGFKPGDSCINQLLAITHEI